MTSTTRTHALYRFYNAEGALLYVGITSNPGSRFSEHALEKPWWHEVTQITLETHPSREAALACERLAIIEERPRYNVVHNRGARLSLHDQIYGRLGLTADTMPDDCHDRCVDEAGIMALYYPYKWRSDGRAWYQCQHGHRWICWWGHERSGEAPEHRGIPVEVYS